MHAHTHGVIFFFHVLNIGFGLNQLALIINNLEYDKLAYSPANWNRDKGQCVRTSGEEGGYCIQTAAVSPSRAPDLVETKDFSKNTKQTH